MTLVCRLQKTSMAINLILSMVPLIEFLGVDLEVEKALGEVFLVITTKGDTLEIGINHIRGKCGFSPKPQKRYEGMLPLPIQRMEQCKSGKLRLHLPQWLKITNDAFIIQSISGYLIEFESEPIQQNIPGEIPFSEEQKDIADAEIQLLLQKGAIVPSNEEQNQFISTIFVVPKGKGKFRPVINLNKTKLCSGPASREQIVNV